MIWWLSTAAVAGYVAVRGILILRAQRGYRDFENSEQFLLHICPLIDQIALF